MNRKQEYEIYRLSGDWRLFKLLIWYNYIWLVCFLTKKCVNGYVLATSVHFLPPCSYQLLVTFQGMIFSNSKSILEGNFAEIFPCILGKSYLSERLCWCIWRPLCLFHIKTRNREQMNVLWTSNLVDPHAMVFCVQQCLKKLAGDASASVNNLCNERNLIVSFYKDFFESYLFTEICLRRGL